MTDVDWLMLGLWCGIASLLLLQVLAHLIAGGLIRLCEWWYK